MHTIGGSIHSHVDGPILHDVEGRKLWRSFHREQPERIIDIKILENLETFDLVKKILFQTMGCLKNKCKNLELLTHKPILETHHPF